ncbi:YbcC family protein [Algoriphagus namhaensis]|uniref:Probable inorganic carbon transporter subunit DabA n=1 Tax=Algoriphagus namhaensis TaxID=915353 RepID=A0ABV8AX19_9BACT
MSISQGKTAFSLEDAIYKLRHYLPSQAPLKDFVHHNTLHAFQDLSFHHALKSAKVKFGYKGYLSFKAYQELFQKGKIKESVLDRILKEKYGNNWILEKQEMLSPMSDQVQLGLVGSFRAHWKSDYHINLDKRVHPFLFRLLSAYFDQGISLWPFPIESKGFLQAIKTMHEMSYSSIFKSPRVVKLIEHPKLDLEMVLDILVGKPDSYGWYLFDQQFAHPGWSGMVSVLQDQPSSLLDSRPIDFNDLLIFECLLEIDYLDQKFGENWIPIGIKHPFDTSVLFQKQKLNSEDTLISLWQEAFEWSYYDEVLAGIAHVPSESESKKIPSFQAMFCIDDRECSIRRHVEFVDPECATFGTPGFFNVEFYFQPEFGKFHTKVCPAPMDPKYLIRETASNKKLGKEIHFHQNNHSLVGGWLSAQTVGFWSALRLIKNIFSPSSSDLEVSSFKHMDPDGSLSIEHSGEFQEGLQIGFKISEMADRVEGLLRSIGLIDGFSPLLYLISHGASSINNTHYAGYDCGACCGRPGSVNARVAAYMANDPRVREILRDRGMNIPETTQFVGALHDTTKDEIAYFDLEVLSPGNRELHQRNLEVFKKSLDINAVERSRRFATLSKDKSTSSIHDSVKKRAFSLFEPRPEYNHATNSLCIVSRKSTIKNLFFDRRAFLNSYDYRKDSEGVALNKILAAAAPVCGGINLEYYFSRMDNERLGAGTKLPHNVMGLIGVANGADGDLRTGLPYQMVEIHDPIRLMLIVEHHIDVIWKVLQNAPNTFEWIKNYWVHFVVIEPKTKVFYQYKEGEFEAYEPLTPTSHVDHLTDTLRSSSENLPVYLIDSL